MIVLVSKLVARVQAAVNAEYSFKHANAGFSTEIPPVNMMYLPIFDKLRREDRVFL